MSFELELRRWLAWRIRVLRRQSQQSHAGMRGDPDALLVPGSMATASDSQGWSAIAGFDRPPGSL